MMNLAFSKYRYFNSTAGRSSTNEPDPFDAVIDKRVCST